MRTRTRLIMDPPVRASRPSRGFTKSELAALTEHQALVQDFKRIRELRARGFRVIEPENWNGSTLRRCRACNGHGRTFGFPEVTGCWRCARTGLVAPSSLGRWMVGPLVGDRRNRNDGEFAEVPLEGALGGGDHAAE